MPERVTGHHATGGPPPSRLVHPTSTEIVTAPGRNYYRLGRLTEMTTQLFGYKCGRVLLQNCHGTYCAWACRVLRQTSYQRGSPQGRYGGLHRKELRYSQRPRTFKETLGTEVGRCQEDCTSSRKSGNTGKGWWVKTCTGLKTERRCSSAAFQGTWRKLEAHSISARTELEGGVTTVSQATSELGPISWVISWTSVSCK
ncbi:hypothetical protein EOD39_3135 [Acipenser ruthenus]|uniref:Uncharacterized protein n=1 Tax=Acipenser ruthenus TaxID=7906 RepID=A0A444UPX9_ACIRT|nr:hypothetical protein EOD39_3135 [Acipenser ruthenus]